MNIDPANIAAIRSLGYTDEEARFLYIVAMHSGYFVARQFLAAIGAKWSKWSRRFTAKVERLGHASWRQYDGAGMVYHLFSRTIHRRIGNESFLNRRQHSVEFIRTRLLLLDFILAKPSHCYLETEQDKLRYFCEKRGLSRTTLPARSYPKGPGTEPKLRYFVDKFPLFVDHTGPSPLVTFSYVDGEQASFARFAKHLELYSPLFRQIGDFAFLYIASSPVHWVRAEECFCSRVKRPLEADASGEVIRYFRLRNAWDRKQYGTLSTGEIEWLKDAIVRFHGERFEGWYRAWSSGALPEEALRKEFGELAAPRKITFRPWIVESGRFAGNTFPPGDAAALPPTDSSDASWSVSPARGSQPNVKKTIEENLNSSGTSCRAGATEAPHGLARGSNSEFGTE